MSLAVIYRWRVTPGMEDQFVRAWSEGTAAIHARCPSYGARLHRGEADLWISYARWPDDAARRACFKDNDFRDLGFAEMRAAVAETLPEIVMEIVDDQLDEPEGGEDAARLPPPPAIDLGDGLALRPLDPDADAEALHACLGDPDAARHLPMPPSADVAETRARLARWSGPASPQWVITRDEGPALGRITLVLRRAGVAEVGVQVAPAAQRQGLARRAVLAAVGLALGDWGLQRVEADIDPDNLASARLFAAAGFVLEGRLKDTWLTPAGPADSLIYAATRGWAPPV